MKYKIIASCLVFLSMLGLSPTNADVIEITTGEISGVVEVGSTEETKINRAYVFGPASKNIYPNPISNEVPYSLTASVPNGVSLNTSVRAYAYMDQNRDRIEFDYQSVTVNAGETLSGVDFSLASPGFVEGSVIPSGSTLSNAYLQVSPASTTYPRAITNISSDGAFRFPVAPGSNARILGRAFFSNGTYVDIPQQTINVSANGTTQINFNVTAPSPSPEPETGTISGNISIPGLVQLSRTFTQVIGPDHSYQYLYGPFDTVTDGIFENSANYTFDSLETGTYTQYFYAYFDDDDTSNLRSIQFPFSSYDSVFTPAYRPTVFADSTSTVNVSAGQALLRGHLDFSGSVSLNDASYIQLYAYPSAGSGVSYEYVNPMGTGLYEFVVTPGSWTVYNLNTQFFKYDNNPGFYRNVNLFYRDYDNINNPVALLEGGEGVQDFNIPLGTVSLIVRSSGSQVFTNPYVSTGCYIRNENNQIISYFSIFARSINQVNVTEGVVNIVAPASDCIHNVYANINGSNLYVGSINLSIVAGANQVTDVGGPSLTIDFPEPDTVIDANQITVTGNSSDDVAVDSITVNGNPATLTPVTGDYSNVLFEVTNVPLPSKGPNQLVTISTDTSGNVTQDTRTVYSDSAPPEISWTPIDSAVTNQLSVTVEGTATDDAGIDSVTVNGVPVTLSPSSGSTFVDYSTSVSLVEGTNSITVSATDISERTTSETHVITVSLNSPPVANTGGPYSVDEGSSVTLDGTGSSDPDGDTLAYEWDFDSDGIYDDATGSNPIFDAAVLDDSTVSVGLRVTDPSGETAIASTTVTVQNVAPIVSAGSDTIINEGDAYTLGASFTDPGTSDTHTIAVDWGDGSSAGNSLTESHIYTDNGSYTVSVRVTDKDGGVGGDSLVVTVNNVAPIVEAGSNFSGNEGDTLNLAASFSDPGTSDTHTIAVDWGDGSTGTALTDGHHYADNGIYTVTVTVTDVDGGVGSDTLTATVANVAPTVEAGSDLSGNEGDTLNLAASFSDLGTSDTHTIAVDWGDGYTGTSLSGSHTYADNGIYTVTVTVTDDDGGVGSDTLTATVANVAPSVEAGAGATIDEGGTFALSGADYSDPAEAVDGPFSIDVDWGDGSAHGSSLVDVHAYADDGIYTVTVSVTDKDGGTGSDTLTVTVDNVAPSVSAGSDQSINEGDNIVLSAGFSDPGTTDTHTIVVDWGDGNTGNSLSDNHQYLDDGVYTVTVTVTDDDGGVGSDTFTVTAADVVPVVTGFDSSLDPVAVGQSVDANGTYQCVSVDACTVDIDWGDGYTGAAIADSGNSYASHTYSAPGIYTLIITVTDDDSSSDSTIFQYVVVYDPNGSFVTGGGWIDSPEGAYLDDPTLFGKANFGFVSKYKKGANIPEGHTEFQFKVADLNFKSVDYQWLVVAGARAQFKGTGTINGEGNYGFFITAIDEALTESSSIDLFRIKIWDIDNGDLVVYDNEVDVADDADPTTEIGGGSIVIHTSKGKK